MNEGHANPIASFSESIHSVWTEPAQRLVLEHLDDVLNTEIVYLVQTTDGELFTNMVRFVSGASGRILGCQPPEFLHDPHLWRSLVHPEDLPSVTATTTAICESRKPGVRRYRLRNKLTGSYVWLEDRVVPELDAAGAVVGIFGVARDVTENKRAEEALLASERFARGTLDGLSSRIGILDDKGVIIGFNQAWMDFERHRAKGSAAISAGMNYLEICESTTSSASGLPPGFVEGIKAVIAGGRAEFLLEYPCQMQQEERWFLGRVTRFAGEGPVRVVVAHSDITKVKRTEGALQLRGAALEAVANAIFITDPLGTIEWVNPAFTSLSGYTVDETVGRKPSIVRSDAHNEYFYRELWQTILAGSVWRGQITNRRKNGQLFISEQTIAPVKDPEGRITHFVSVQQDITDRLKMEEKIRQTQKMESIGQLAGGVAHDFNNVLAVILAQSDLLMLDGNLSKETSEGLDQIRLAARKAALLTRQLLLFSRQEVMQSRELDLNEVVTNLAKMLQRIIGEDVRLQLHLHPAPLMTRADAGMLDQVLLNLAVNARDAMPGGGRLLIETALKSLDKDISSLRPDASPGRYVWMSVSDTGAGIPPEVLPHIFEPFFTTKESGKGTGIGLATVFGIVKQHKGWIKAYSEPGRGTNFQVYLPASTATLSEDPAVPVPVWPRGTETILLVEDEVSVRTVTASLLQRHGYSVVEAGSGPEALRMWKQHRARIGLLLTDLVMPGGLTGHQLAAMLREDEPTLAVLYTSGYSTELAGKELELRSGENFVQKPYASDQLLQTVRRCIDDRTQRLPGQ